MTQLKPNDMKNKAKTLALVPVSSAKSIPPHITALIKAERAIDRVRGFDPAQVKRDITAKLSGGIAGDRVKALLANPDAVKKLDETLEALSA